MKLDFSDIMIMTPSIGKSRSVKLFATIMNVLSNVTGVHWIIDIEQSVEKSIIDDILDLANVTGNMVDFAVREPVQQSVGRRKVDMINFWVNHKNKRNWLLNVDDDFILPYETLSIVYQASRHLSIKYFSLCQFDIRNIRGYADWDKIVRRPSDLKLFIEKNGIEKVNSHLWEAYDSLVLENTVGISSGCFMMNRHADIQSVIGILSEFEKGERLSDVAIAKIIGEGYILVGANVYHLVNEEYFNKKWQKEKNLE